MRIKIAITSLFLFLLLGLNFVLSDTGKINIYFFYGDGCPHCEDERPFLENLEEKYSDITIHYLEVWKNENNRKLLTDVAKNLDTNVSGVPFTVIGEKYFVGWYDKKSTGAAIEEAIKCAQKEGYSDIAGNIIAGDTCGPDNDKDQSCDCDEKKSPIPEEINVPLLGKIEIKKYSLPLLTIVMGALDGFNPCAMWTLLFLIGLLLNMEDKRKMWTLGSTFIIISASVYFIFMSAWLNLLLFVGFIFWVRALIGCIALAGGIYNLKEYYTNPQSGCKVTGSEKRRKIFDKLKEITYQKNFLLALGGIIVLAFAVNLVELVCSAGLPAVYTQILALSDLSRWQYYIYILFYVFIFMLDDLFIFFVAMFTLKMTGITTKYSRISHLVGGILMLIVGLLLIFKPGWLMFG